jgi:hypothetical protein
MALLPIAVVVLSAGPGFCKTDDEMRLAIAPFKSTLGPEEQSESVAGLGATIAAKLTTLFVQKLRADSDVIIISGDVVSMAWDQAGLAQMGLVDSEHAAKLGEILQANFVWCGTYALTGQEITVEATLWSIQRGAAEPGFVAVVPRSAFVADLESIDALSCALFSKMYELIEGERASITCPGVLPSGKLLPKVIVIEAPFPVGQVSATVRVGLTTVGMGIVNNIITTATELNPSLELDEIGWAYEADFRAGYGFAPGLDATAGVKLLQASRNAGGSANVSLEVSAVSALLGLSYHFRVGDVELAAEGRAGWASGQLYKNDQWGYLPCPAMAATGGMAFEAALTASLPLNPSWSLDVGISYKGMGLTGPFVEVPMLDFSGVGLRVAMSATLGGHYPGVERGTKR